MRKVARFQVAPDDFDVVQLGGVFGQPFDGEPVGAFGQRRPAGLAEVDRSIVEDEDHRLRRRPGFGAVEAVERLQMLDEVCAPLGPGRRDDQLAPGVIERAHHRDVLDNGPIHLSKASRAALAERAHWLTVEWLPKYAPELNDIEIVWGDLKARHLAHRTFIDLDSLDSAIHHAVTDLNSTRNRDPLDSQRISA